jgi:ABC-2 type transport system ATP-binding protein
VTALLRLRNVEKRYGRAARVLAGIDLEVRREDVIGVVGTNGSGKSTLLRILAGLSRPSSGTVTGRPSVGYVPDRFPAASRMSPLSYLAHLGRISGQSDVDRRAVELLERLALVGDPRAPMRQLSKGNAQKVALAQALLAEPDLLVLDEPWSGLDHATHGVLGELIAETRARGASVVFAEHRDDFARQRATEVFHLAEGALRQAGLEPCARIVLRENGEQIELSVPVSRADAVLLEALQRGSSVIKVQR